MSKYLLIAILFFASQTASANQGEVCTEIEWDDHHAQSLKGLNNKDVYNCPSLGNLTIPQIYEKGWRIVLQDSILLSDKEGVYPRIKRTLLIEKID